MLESKKQHANVKNKDSPQRQKTISCCSKGWTNMRNDQSVKPKHIRWDRKGCRDFVVGCRVTDEKASAVPGIFWQPEEGCHITSSVLSHLLQGECSWVCQQQQQQSICFQSPEGQTKKRLWRVCVYGSIISLVFV